MSRTRIAMVALLLVAGCAKRPVYNPSAVWPRDFGTGGAPPHESVESDFAEGLEAAGGGLLVVDPRLSAVADAVALDEIVDDERTGAEVFRQRRYEGSPHVIVPEFKRFTMAHRALPDARTWARKLGIVQSTEGPMASANGITVGVGSARDGRQRDWVLIVAQGRFTMTDLPRPLPDDLPWSVQAPDVERLDVYWQPAADVPLAGRSGRDAVEVELPSRAEAVSVVATKSGQRFELVRMQLAEPSELRSWTADAIVADVRAFREERGLTDLEPIDVLPCNAVNLADGTPLSGDKTCWTFPAPADGSLWSELRNQPHIWADLLNPRRHYVAVEQDSDELVVQFRSRFQPVAPDKVRAAVGAHRKLAQATWNAEGSRRLDRRLETVRGETLAEDAARIRDEVLDASPLFDAMGETTFAVGYGPRLVDALDQATRGLERMPSQVAVGYRELRTDELGYLHVVAVAAHRRLR